MFPMKDNQITPAQVKVSLPKSYTLTELKELAQQCANEPHVTDDDRVLMQLAYSRLLLWLEQKEKEAND